MPTTASVTDELARLDRRARDLAADPALPADVAAFLRDDLLAGLQRARALLGSYAFTNRTPDLT